MIDADPLFESWEVRLFEQLATRETIHLAFVIALPRPAPADRSRSPILERILALETRLVPHGATRRLSEGFTPLRELPHYPPSARRHKPADILLNHARQPLAEDLALRETEIWSYSPLLNCGATGHGLAPVLADAPYTRIALARSTSGGVTEPLAEALTNTKLVGSYNTAFAEDILPTLTLRELEAARLGLPPADLAPVDPPPLALSPPDPAAADAAPGDTTASAPSAARRPLAYASCISRRLAREMIDRGAARFGAVPGRWSLLVGEGDILAHDLAGLTELEQPGTEHRADPFLHTHKGETWVFHEAFGAGLPHGEIRASRLAGNRLVDEQTLNFGSIHVSYPHVFSHDGETYMLPETHQRGRVEVWRCVTYPDRWVLHAHALDGTAPADSSLVEHAGTWWLFTSHGSGRLPDYCRELHIYRVSGPDLSDLVPHARNPVLIDTTRARMGGRFFSRDGVLYRPGQNTSYGLYGFGLSIMAVEDLTLTTYRERRVRTIVPDRARGTTGCHHLDAGADGTGRFILDARRAFGRPPFGARPIRLKAE